MPSFLAKTWFGKSQTFPADEVGLRRLSALLRMITSLSTSSSRMPSSTASKIIPPAKLYAYGEAQARTYAIQEHVEQIIHE